MIEWLAIYCLLGAIVGFLAGLLGIGGGIIMVPVLAQLFSQQAFPDHLIMHFALATSMSAIMVTAVSSMLAHQRTGKIHWPIVRQLTPGIILGTLLATRLISEIDSRILSLIFALFLAYVVFSLLVKIDIKANRPLPERWTVAFIGLIIGTVSALVSIGGGTLTIPFLLWHRIDLRKAIATSAAVGVPISLFATLGYVINSNSVEIIHNQHIHQATLGYIYLPAMLCITLTSVFTAPLGARAAHSWPVKIIEKILAALLLMLGANLLLSHW